MTQSKKLTYIIAIFILILITGVFAFYKGDVSICNKYSICSYNLVFSYGKPVINFFSIILAFITPLVLASERFLKFWIEKILIFITIPALITIAVPVTCDGWICLTPGKEWVASVTALLFVGVMALAMLLDVLFFKKQK